MLSISEKKIAQYRPSVDDTGFRPSLIAAPIYIRHNIYMGRKGSSWLYSLYGYIILQDLQIFNGFISRYMHIITLSIPWKVFQHCLLYLLVPLRGLIPLKTEKGKVIVIRDMLTQVSDVGERECNSAKSGAFKMSKNDYSLFHLQLAIGTC